MKNSSYLMASAVLAAVLCACSGSGPALSTGGGPSGGDGGSSASGGGSSSSTTSNSGSSSSDPSFSLPSVDTGAPMGELAAARLLMQGTFGASLDSLAEATGHSYDFWFQTQAALPFTLSRPVVDKGGNNFQEVWFYNSTNAKDQLRQRIAYTLSEIMVVSDQAGPLVGRDKLQAYYYDYLVRDAFGNFRKLLEDVTLTPTMGKYLSMFKNDKGDPANGIHADQNYAREIMQLFTVGLVKLNLDGTVQTDSNNVPIPTYGQPEVEALARVFTGWGSAPAGNTGENAWQYDLNDSAQMVAYANHHDTTAKTIIGGTQIAAGQTAEAELKQALDTLFNHPNVGPFLGKQLIQHLVTSNPSRGYIQRVAQTFNNDGTGVRGNMFAVVKAVLTDPEAVTPGDPVTYGKLREPLVRLINLWRAFNGSAASGNPAEPFTFSGYVFDAYGQYPLAAASVFNFFQPSYKPSGLMKDSGLGLYGPEFQITNEATLAGTNNNLQLQAYTYVDAQGHPHFNPENDSQQISPSFVALHISPQWAALAADPSALVDKLNVIFMAGQMPPEVKSALVNYATGVNGPPQSGLAYDNASARVLETAELLLESPQYAVQR